jgi:hypothetical protein
LQENNLSKGSYTPLWGVRKSKIGFIVNNFSAGQDDEWLFEQQAQMSLNIFRTIQTDFNLRAEYLR